MPHDKSKDEDALDVERARIAAEAVEFARVARAAAEQHHVANAASFERSKEQMEAEHVARVERIDGEVSAAVEARSAPRLGRRG